MRKEHLSTQKLVHNNVYQNSFPSIIWPDCKDKYNTPNSSKYSVVFVNRNCLGFSSLTPKSISFVKKVAGRITRQKSFEHSNLVDNISVHMVSMFGGLGFGFGLGFFPHNLLNVKLLVISTLMISQALFILTILRSKTFLNTVPLETHQISKY